MAAQQNRSQSALPLRFPESRGSQMLRIEFVFPGLENLGSFPERAQFIPCGQRQRLIPKLTHRAVVYQASTAIRSLQQTRWVVVRGSNRYSSSYVLSPADTRRAELRK